MYENERKKLSAGNQREECIFAKMIKSSANKAGYTAKDAPSARLKITRDGRTYGRTYGRTDGRTDTPSYRDATAHLKSVLTHESITEKIHWEPRLFVN